MLSRRLGYPTYPFSPMAMADFFLVKGSPTAVDKWPLKMPLLNVVNFSMTLCFVFGGEFNWLYVIYSV